jgi:hypothetical protein
MMVQILLGPPNFFEHKDVIFLQVPVDVATKTAWFDQGLISDRSEDFQCLITLSGWYRHPYGRLNHVLLHFLTLLTDRPCFV